MEKMMQSKETINDGLKREFRILIPASDVETKLMNRLGEIAKTAQMPGFRPGKVPVALLRKTHGNAIMGEVVEQTINESTQSTISDNELRPVSQPNVEIKTMEEGKDLEYTIGFEVFPEIKLIDLKGIKLERMKGPASEQEVEATLQKIADSQGQTRPLTKRKTAQSGDIAVLNFVGRVDGEEFPGGKADNYSLEIGSGSFVPGFEEQLVNKSVGETFDVNVTFPENYTEELAGKNAVFEVTINELQEGVPADVNDEIAKKMGVENLGELRKNIRESHEQELNSFSRMRVKKELLDILNDKHTFDLPEALAEDEFLAIWNEFSHRREHHPDQVDDSDKDKTDDELKTEYREIANRRLRLGLLIAEIGRVNDVSVSSEELNRGMMQEAQRHSGQEKEFMEQLKNDINSQQALQSRLLEEKVVDFIIEMADVKDRDVTIEELMKEEQVVQSVSSKPNQAKSAKKKSKKKKTSTKTKTTKSKEK